MFAMSVKMPLMLPLMTVVLSTFALQYDDLVVLGRNDTLKVTENAVFAKGLTGEGRIVNETDTSYVLTFQGGSGEMPCVFSGSMAGKLDLVSKSGNQQFVNPDIQIFGTCEGYAHADGGSGGTLGFVSFQGLDGNFIDRTGLRLCWLGREHQTVTQNFVCFGTESGVLEIDGGSYGGLTMTGVCAMHSSAPYQRIVVLNGLNVEECVLTNRLLRTVNANSPSGGCSFHVIKRGDGIWKLAEGVVEKDQEPFSGAITVESGILRFDSLAERGSNCALGTALDLYEAKNATASRQVSSVAYAVKLGSANSEATLEYVGARAGCSSSRPLAIDGRARLVNASKSKFALSDIYPVASESVLTLAGDELDAESILSGVNDRKKDARGDLSLVKEGLGTWTLCGANDIHGAVSVRKGTLILKNHYTWYRWNIKATQLMNGGSGDSLTVVADEFGLYSVDGTRQNRGFVGCDDFAALGPGQICFGFVKGTWTPNWDPVNEAGQLCADTTISMAEWYRIGGVGVSHQTPEDPSTWMSVVVRLPDGMPTVVGYDVAFGVDPRSPLVWSVDASVDGERWDEVSATVTNQANDAGWQYARRAHVGNGDEKHLDANGNPDMQLFAKAKPSADDFMPNVSSCSVSAGATLKIVGDVSLHALTVDCLDAGTIDGATFAEQGVLTIENLPAGAGITLPLVVKNTKGLANLENWTVRVSGKKKKRVKVRVTDDQIVIDGNGFVLCLDVDASGSGIMPLAEYETERAELLARPRQVIADNDGCDMLYYDRRLPITEKAFIDSRIGYVSGTRLDMLVYTPVSAGFGLFTALKAGETLDWTIPYQDTTNAVRAFEAIVGKDCLQMAIDFCHGEGREIFVGIRMNDTHDSDDDDLFPQWKRENPDCLFGTKESRPPRCKWSAVDFANPKVRARMLSFMRQFFENYDIDGVSYDFNRHFHLFKSVAWGRTEQEANASQEQLDLMARFMRELKDLADECGRKRGRPILVLVRVYDSVDYIKAAGVDIERWMDERSIDMLATGGYFRLNPWHVMAEVVHRHGMKVYASMDDSRIGTLPTPFHPYGYLPGRNESMFSAARIAEAMSEGVDGIFFFNTQMHWLHEYASIDPLATEGLDKEYFAAERGSGGDLPWNYVYDGGRYSNYCQIDPWRPPEVCPGGSYSFTISVGDDFGSSVAKARAPKATALAMMNYTEPADVRLNVNGLVLKSADFTSDNATNGVFSFDVPVACLRRGPNDFRLMAPSDKIPENAEGKILFVDFKLRVKYQN